MSKDNQKLRKWARREPCPHEIVSIHDHLSWHRDADGFDVEAAPEATPATPGSLEKMNVMRERVEMGEQLFNVRDGLVDLD